MGAIMRSHDWTASPLGLPETWPQSLCSMVSVCLNSPILGAILWGPELRMLYNDAYVPSMADRHPAALGRPVAQVWGDAWDRVAPAFYHCLETGEGFSQTGVELPMVRRGKLETTYWNFSAAPVRGEDGSIVGLFNQGVEITERVAAEAEVRADADLKAFRLSLEERLRDLADPEQIIAMTSEQLGRRLGVGQIAYGELDASGLYVDVFRDWNDGTFATLSGRRRVADFGISFSTELKRGHTVAVDDVHTDHRTARAEVLPAFEVLGISALINVPLNKEGRLVAVLGIHSGTPRRWTPADLALVSEIAERTWAALVRARTHRLLRHSEGRLGTALAIAKLGSFEWRLKTQEVEFDDRAREIFGLPADVSLTADDILQRIHPADRPLIEAQRLPQGRLAGQQENEYRLSVPGFPLRLVRSVTELWTSNDGQAERVIGVLEDVTARREAEARLRESEEFNRRVLASSDDCIKVLDLDARIIFMSEGGQRMMEVSDFNTVRGLPWLDFWTDNGKREAIAAIESAKQGKSYRFEGEADTMKHTPKWWDVQVTPVFGADGQPEKLLSVSRDITKGKQVELELQALNDTLERRIIERTQDRNSLWELSSDIMLRCSFDGLIVAVNPAWAEVLGWSEEELVGGNVFDLVHPDDLEDTRSGARASAQGHSYARFDNRYRHKDRSYRWISWSTSPDRGIINAVGRNFTLERARSEALKVAEESLRQAQKMEAVGQLTGGLAHDFNNLLAGISGSLELMQTRMGQGRVADVERYMAAAQGATKRAAALTHRLLAFSRRQTLAPKATDVNRLINGMEELVRRTIGPAIRLEVRLEPDLWPALVDPSQLENALLNLCINSRDAMPDGGRITITSANHWLDRSTAEVHDLPNGQYLSLSITDTGTGMPADVVARAFEPFFTTKPIGAGTGLGLSMIYGFAHQSGGQVKISSQIDQGTTVCIHLPRHHRQGELAGGIEQAEAMPRAEQGETVLVVDDEPTVRMLVTDILEELGYTAIEAGDSSSGLAVLQSDVRIDMLVSDVGLPGGMNGRQMADAGRVSRPDLKVLFITGYAESAVIGNGDLPAGMQVLTKPFSIDVMAARIREILKS